MPALLRSIERALLARRPSAWQRFVLGLTRLLRPGVLETREGLRRHMAAALRVSVRAYGDDDPDLYRRLRMGDTWMKLGLMAALGRAGFRVTDCDPDVVIHLHGEPAELPARAFKILWVHCNPETVTRARLARYDHVFCASTQLRARLRAAGCPAELLWPATGLRPRPGPLRYQAVFVGNARPDGSRPILEHLRGAGLDLRVWGGGYRELPCGTWMGGYAEYHDLPEIYGASLVVLNDHWPSMTEAGLFAPRVYDVLASGGFCISEANAGLGEVFGDSVPQYRSPEELRTLVRHFLEHPEERLPLMARGQAIAQAATWDDRARTLMAAVASGPIP